MSVALVASSALLVYSQVSGLYDTRSLCPGVCPIRRPPGSLEGVWWTILASNTSIGQCGLLNNQCPCKCLGFKLSSYCSQPYTPQYNQTAFGYNTERRCYDEQFQDVDHVDRNSPWEVYKVTDKNTGETAIASIIDTDNFNTFFLAVICSVKTAQGEPLILAISRNIKGLSPKNQKRIDAVLRANNLCPEKLIVVNRRNCPRYVS